MGRNYVSPETREKILAEWRTGEYTHRDLSLRNEVSVGFVFKLTKDIPKDLSSVVNSGIEYRTAVLRENEQTVHVMNEIVDEKTRHIAFFANATIKNVSLMMEKIDNTISIDEHKTAQDAILKGRETVLGKSPEMAIQINNQLPKKSLDDYTDEELIAIIEAKN